MSQKLFIDLSGQGGLSPNYYGNSDTLTPQPQYQYIGSETQLASGFFNPFLREGYLAPAPADGQAVSVSEAATLTSVVYDNVSDTVYWAEHANTIFEGDTLNDTSLSQFKQLQSNHQITDLEIYEVNGKRNLFFSYLDTSPTSLTVETYFSEPTQWVSVGLSVAPETAGQKPAIVYQDSYYTYLDGAMDNTFTINVPSGITNPGVIVAVVGAEVVTAASYEGNAMTLIQSEKWTQVSDAAISTFQATNVTAGNNAFSLTVGTGTYAKVFVMILENVEQTGGFISDSDEAEYLASMNVEELSFSSTDVRGPSAYQYSPFLRKDTGTTMYTYNGSGGGVIVQYTLGTAYDTSSTFTSAGTYNANAEVGSVVYSVFIKPDGTKMYLNNSTNIYQYTLGTPWDITTASYDSKTSAVSNPAGAPITLSPDGTKLYLPSGTYLTLSQYTLSTPWDISTATLDGRSHLSSVASGLQDFEFNPDGTEAILLVATASSANKLVYLTHIQLSTAYSFLSEITTVNTVQLSELDDDGVDNYEPNKIIYLEDQYRLIIHRGKTNGSQNGDYTTYFLGNTTAENVMTITSDSLVIQIAALANITSSTVFSIGSSQRWIFQQTAYTSGSATGAKYTAVSYDNNTFSPVYVGTSLIPTGPMDETYSFDTVTNGTILYSKTDPFMRNSDNGFMYIFTSDGVHKLDGSTIGGVNGTLTPYVLQFPEHHTLTDAVEYRSNFYIVVHQYQVDTTDTTQTNYTVPAGVYVWNRYSGVIQMRDYIPVVGIRQIKKIYISPDNALRMITVSSTGITQIRQLNGTSFEVIKELGIGAAPQYHDSLTVDEDKTIWLGSDGTLYCHGRVRPGTEEILTKLFQAKAPSANTTDGFTKNIEAGAVFFGYTSSTPVSGYRQDRQCLTIAYREGQGSGSFVVKQIMPFDISIGSSAQAQMASDIYTLVKYLPGLAQVNYLHLTFLPAAISGSTVAATIKVYRDQQTTPINTTDITYDDISRGFKYIKVGKTDVHAIQLEIEYPASITFANTFFPAYAVVDYEPTTKLK